MIDTEWFAASRPVNDISRVLFINGDDLGQLPRGYHQINVKLEPYGTHHTKMSLLRFKAGLVVAVYSANLIESDWTERTQLVWVSPLLLHWNDEKSKTMESLFQKDLYEYLSGYN